MRKEFRLDKLLPTFGRMLLLMTVAFLPSIVRVAWIPTSPELGFLYPSWPIQADLFCWWKSAAAILVAAALFPLIFFFLAAARRDPPLIYFSLGLYLLFLFLSTWLSRFPQTAREGFPGLYEGGWVLASYVVFFFAARLLFATRAHLPILAAGVSAVLVGVVGVVEMIAGSPFKKWPLRFFIFSTIENANQFRIQLDQVFSTLYHSNFVGSYVALLFPIFFALAFSRLNRAARLASLVVSTLLVVLLIGSASRAGLLGASLGAAVALFFFQRRRARRILGGFGVVVFFAFFAAYFIPRNQLSEKFRQALVELKNGGKPSKPMPITLLDVRDGKARVGRGSEVLVMTSASKGFDLTGKNLVMQRQSDGRLSLGSSPLQSLGIRMENDPEWGPVLRFIVKDAWFTFVSSPEGMKLNFWGVLVDSQTPPLSRWIPNAELFSKRGYIWQRTLPMLRDKFWIGSGAGTFALEFPQRDFLGKLSIDWHVLTIVDRPHNFYFQTVHATGWISLIALLVTFALVYREAITFLRREGTNVEAQLLPGILGGITGYLIAGLFNDSTVCVAPLFWILLGVGFACATSQRLRTK